MVIQLTRTSLDHWRRLYEAMVLVICAKSGGFVKIHSLKPQICSMWHPHIHNRHALGPSVGISIWGYNGPWRGPYPYPDEPVWRLGTGGWLGRAFL